MAVGEDTPGDVQIVPHGQEPKASQPQLEFSSADWFGKIRFTELLTESGVVDRVALPGVQDKVSARMISVPVTVDGGDFILKIDPPEFKNASANEYFFNGVAKRSKLQVADVELVHDAEGNAGLLSTRFDRTIDDDTTLALSLAGKTSGLSRKRMATFATAVGLTERVFDAVVDDILRGTADLVDRLEDRPFPMTDQQQRNLIRTIRFRRQGLAG